MMSWKRFAVGLALCLWPVCAQAERMAEAGSISGTVTFGSEYLPPFRIYAISIIDRNTYFAVATEMDQQSFEIPGVAPGRYVVVAYTDPGRETLLSGWLRDDELVPVTVTAGGSVTGVVLTDAHSPDGFPQEPPPTPGLGVEAPSCHARSPQMAVGMCFTEAYERADRALNAEYRRVMALKNVPQRCRDLLRDAQRAWIPFRDAHCGYEGDALYSGRGAECMWEVTVERTEYLKLQDRDVCLRSQ